MTRLLPVLVWCLAHAAAAQVALTAQSGEPPAPEPHIVEVQGDGRCTAARPGDTVHFTLTIEGVDGAHSVFGDLRLRQGHSHEATRGGLPVPDFRSLGGGGLGTRDADDGNLYHFTFKVPNEIFGGTYRGVNVNVRADQPEPLYQPSGLHAPKVEVTRRTRDAVHAFCLNVISSFGVRNRAAVTNFEPGPVDPPPAPPAPVRPIPLPR